ncbi:MAG: hypothetical protein WCP52_04145 [Bacteroidota bacterium]
MPRKPRLNVDLSDESDDVFYTTVMLIYNLLTLNVALFTGIPVPMGALDPLSPLKFGGAITIFNNTRLLPTYDGKTADVAKARLEVQKMVRQNGDWLNIFCNGDLTLLKKTGYPLSKEDEAQGKLEQSEITLVPIKGGMDFMISHVKGSNLRYAVMYTLATNIEDDPAKWDHFHYAGNRDGTILDLQRNVDYKFSSFAMGTSTNLTYSNALTAKPL